MAMAKCRECGSDVSDSAKTCPKCGISTPVKKTSLLVKLILGFFALAVFGQVVARLGGATSDGASSSASNQPAKLTEDELANNVEVKQFTWNTGGFNTVMVISKISIENKNKEAVKDFELECTHTGPSGTVIDRNKLTVFQILPAGKTSSFKDLNMGFIRAQAAKSFCKVASVKRMS